MNEKTRGWTDFWINEKEAFVRIMQLATSVFAKRFLKQFGPIEGKWVLDYGCGPGLLADSLNGAGATIAGADINAYFLAVYKSKHPTAELLHLNLQRDNRALLDTAFGTHGFDFIILLSITQYFKDESEFRKTLSVLRSLLRAGGKIIVADVVPPNHSAIGDGLSLLKECIRTKHLTDMVRFLFYLFSSSYRKHSSTTPLLEFSQAQFEKIASDLNLTCKVVPHLTLHTGRLNFILAVR